MMYRELFRLKDEVRTQEEKYIETMLNNLARSFAVGCFQFNRVVPRYTTPRARDPWLTSHTRSAESRARDAAVITVAG